MCTRHSELNGADSVEALNPTEWRVTMCDRFEPEIRFDVRIPAAMGRYDAMSQARLTYPWCSVLDAREAAPTQ